MTALRDGMLLPRSCADDRQRGPKKATATQQVAGSWIGRRARVFRLTGRRVESVAAPDFLRHRGTEGNAGESGAHRSIRRRLRTAASGASRPATTWNTAVSKNASCSTRQVTQRPTAPREKKKQVARKTTQVCVAEARTTKKYKTAREHESHLGKRKRKPRLSAANTFRTRRGAPWIDRTCRLASLDAFTFSADV